MDGGGGSPSRRERMETHRPSPVGVPGATGVADEYHRRLLRSPIRSPSRGDPLRPERSPKTPTAAQRQLYSDRFIPSRRTSLFDVALDGGGSPKRARERRESAGAERPNAGAGGAGSSNAGAGQQTTRGEEPSSTYSLLLQNEVLGGALPPAGASSPPPANNRRGGGSDDPATASPLGDSGGGGALAGGRAMLRFVEEVPGTSAAGGGQAVPEALSLTNLGPQSVRLLNSPLKSTRRIPKYPFKVLDAPSLEDDFYLNLVDWSSQNVLAVGLRNCVYLWHASTSKVTKLCDLGSDTVASVAWTQRGTHLAIGTSLGAVQIWDASKCKKTRTMHGHTARVGALAWNNHILTSGSRDRIIYHRDVRSSENYTAKLVAHKQEICGLKWSPESQLASGGNDNRLLIWDAANSQAPLHRFTEHCAAVKAIAWSPHQRGLLASGGGTADRTIRFWNTMTSRHLHHVDTGSQVCNLAWSKNANELVSTHGYSQNQISLWRYPSMTPLATLTGHSLRVLYLAVSPDGQTIVTGAGDETLRFWNVFPGPKTSGGVAKSGILYPERTSIR